MDPAVTAGIISGLFGLGVGTIAGRASKKTAEVTTQPQHDRLRHERLDAIKEEWTIANERIDRLRFPQLDALPDAYRLTYACEAKSALVKVQLMSQETLDSDFEALMEALSSPSDPAFETEIAKWPSTKTAVLKVLHTST